MIVVNIASVKPVREMRNWALCIGRFAPSITLLHLRTVHVIAAVLYLFTLVWTKS
jgi:hypothetical protein